MAPDTFKSIPANKFPARASNHRALVNAAVVRENPYCRLVVNSTRNEIKECTSLGAARLGKTFFQSSATITHILRRRKCRNRTLAPDIFNAAFDVSC